MDNIYNVIRLKHDGLEKKGFILKRIYGTEDFTFIHFKTPVNIYQDSNIITARPGACILYEPGSYHFFESAECDLVHDWIHFLPVNKLEHKSSEGCQISEGFQGSNWCQKSEMCPTNSIFNFKKEHVTYDELKTLTIPLNKIFYPTRTYFITNRIMNCEIEFINKEPYWREVISSEISLLLMQLSRELIRDNSNSTAVDSIYLMEMKSRFKQFRTKLYGSAHEEWNIDKMCCELSLSRSRFSVLYHEFFGLSPKDDLIKARLERAKYLLMSIEAKIEQIAYMSGYSNQYHFIRQFKAYTGTTPGEFRARLMGLG